MKNYLFDENLNGIRIIYNPQNNKFFEIYDNECISKELIEKNLFITTKTPICDFFYEHTLYLTLIITTDCNLNCSYCFQDRNLKKNLDCSQIGDYLKKVVEEIDLDDILVLHLSFYGGEPTVHPNILLDVEKKVRDFFPSRIKIFEKIFTNGLYEKTTLHKLSSSSINQFYISIDENRLSCLFDSYLNNISYLLSKEKKIALRYNIDKEKGIRNFKRLLDILISKKIIKNCNVHIVPIWDLNNEKYKQNVTYKFEVLEEIMDEFKLSLIDYPKLRRGPCYLSTKYNYTLNPEGRCTTCHLNPFSYDISKSNELSNSCLECRLYKICGGKCQNGYCNVICSVKEEYLHMIFNLYTKYINICNLKRNSKIYLNSF